MCFSSYLIMNKNKNRIYSLMIFSVIPIVAYTIIIFLYAKIAIVIHKSSQILTKESKAKRLKSFSKVTFITLVSFTLTWIPLSFIGSCFFFFFNLQIFSKFFFFKVSLHYLVMTQLITIITCTLSYF